MKHHWWCYLTALKLSEHKGSYEVAPQGFTHTPYRSLFMGMSYDLLDLVPSNKYIHTEMT